MPRDTYDELEIFINDQGCYSVPVAITPTRKEAIRYAGIWGMEDDVSPEELQRVWMKPHVFGEENGMIVCDKGAPGAVEFWAVN